VCYFHTFRTKKSNFPTLTFFKLFGIPFLHTEEQMTLKFLLHETIDYFFEKLNNVKNDVPQKSESSSNVNLNTEQELRAAKWLEQLGAIDKENEEK